MRDAAKPPISASRTRAGSAPAFAASSSASPTASIVSATMIWLATLVIWPSPLPPTSVMFLPILSNNGFTFAKAASLPPTMMVRLAALAPTSPPDTGASRYSQPSALIRLAKSFVATGEIELMSTTILPAVRADATPSLPNRTSSTCGVSGTMMKMMSACDATSAPFRHTRAPASTRADGVGPTVLVNSVWPSLMRCPAIGAPMMPRPMNPMFAMICLLVV